MTSEQKGTLKAALVSIAAGIVIVAAAFVVPVGGIGSQEPGPPPRVVEPPATPGRARLYTVQIFRNDAYVGELGADRAHELDGLLESIALRWCVPPREWERTPEGWIATWRPVPRPAIAVAIWDHQREAWHHPGGKAMPAEWDGRLPVKVTTNVGSYRIE